MTIIIIEVSPNRYRYETINGAHIGPEFTATRRGTLLLHLELFRQSIRSIFDWNTPTSSLTAARIANTPQ